MVHQWVISRMRDCNYIPMLQNFSSKIVFVLGTSCAFSTEKLIFIPSDHKQKLGKFWTDIAKICPCKKMNCTSKVILQPRNTVMVLHQENDKISSERDFYEVHLWFHLMLNKTTLVLIWYFSRGLERRRFKAEIPLQLELRR